MGIVTSALWNRAALAAVLLPARLAGAEPPKDLPSNAYRGHYGFTMKDQSGRRVYWGHYGYLLRLPPGLTASEGLSDPDTGDTISLVLEAIVSTAVEHGLAFPHVRDVEGGGLTFAVGMKQKGISFGAHEDHLSKIFFFIVIPTPATAFYLRLLAGLVRTFESSEARKELLECDKPDQMWKTLVKLTKDTVP